jgi:hypothetical protein
MMRDFIRLLQLAGLLGCGLSLLGLGLLLYIRINLLQNQAPPGGGVDSPNGALYILDAFKEPGTTFLLSALLFAVCEIAIRMIPRPPPPADDREPDPTT